MTIDQRKAVVLMLDSWSVSATGATGNENIVLYNLEAQVASNNALEESYTINSENAGLAIGHSVVAVGHFEYSGCKWLVIQDNDPSTPRFVGLPFDQACGGTRSVWDALLASFYVLAP